MSKVKLVSYVDSNTREKVEWYELDDKEEYNIRHITFANTISYFCCVVHHTASIFL